MDSIASFTAKSPYFSPSAEFVGIGAADMEVLRHIGDPAKFKDAASAWAGFFCDSTHKIVFRFKDAAGIPLTLHWYVGLYHFKDSACLVWPVKLEDSHQGTDIRMLTFHPLGKPKLIAVLTFQNLVCFPFEWRSWAWQLKNIPDCKDILRPAVRAFKSGKLEDVFKVAARAAWWSLPRATLEKVATHLGINITDCANAFDLLFKLTKTTLGCTDSDALTILEDKMSNMMQNTACASQLLYIDEASACLHEDDRLDIKSEQKKASALQAEVDDIKKHFKVKADVVRRAAGQPTARATLRTSYKGPKKWPNDHIAQKDAKLMMPPDSALWRSRTENIWNGRYKKMPIRSASDSAWGGQHGSLRQAVQWAWECFLDMNDLKKEDCPLKCLWDE